MRESTRRRLTGAAVVSAPFLWTLTFLFVPYLVMFTYSFYLKKFPTFVPAFEFVNYLTIIADPQYYQVLLRTAKIAGSVAVCAFLIGYPLTYFLVFKVKNDKLRSVLYMAVIVPL
mgnify:CR=1 FL=1